MPLTVPSYWLRMERWNTVRAAVAQDALALQSHQTLDFMASGLFS